MTLMRTALRALRFLSQMTVPVTLSRATHKPVAETNTLNGMPHTAAMCRLVSH
jgi:hypothetical protein